MEVIEILEDAVMLKKILIAATVLGIALLVGCAGESSESSYQPRSVVIASSHPIGAYELAGPVKINLKVPKIITANISSPDMSILGSFIGLSANFTGSSGQPGNFQMKMDLLGMPIAITGIWTSTSATKFKAVADLAPLIAQIEEMGGQATVTKNTFTGTMLANGQMKGTFALGVNLRLEDIAATLNISANYKGLPVEMVASSATQRLLGNPEPFVLNDYFATMFEQVVNVAKKAH
jgi:hypothetical protein